jgi:hypothetical protein
MCVKKKTFGKLKGAGAVDAVVEPCPASSVRVARSLQMSGKGECLADYTCLSVDIVPNRVRVIRNLSDTDGSR